MDTDTARVVVSSAHRPLRLDSTRPIDTLPIRPTLRARLYAQGYRTVGDLATGYHQGQVTTRIGVSENELEQIRKHLQLLHREEGDARISNGLTGLDLLQQEEEPNRRITTGIQQLDSLLGGGGIPCGQLVEICGEPGIGKTQLAMQLSVNVQLPQALSGVSGEAVYIDTEGSFRVERVRQLAEYVVKQTNSRLKFNAMRVLDVLHRIHYYRVHTHVELIALIHTLEDFIQTRPKIRLIIIDSIAFPFRQSFANMSQRTRLVTNIARTLLSLARQHQLSVVLINQMTTQFNAAQGASTLVPALGDSWGHMSNMRLTLFWRHSIRYALLFKSPTREDALATFTITPNGLTDANIDVTESS